MDFDSVDGDYYEYEGYYEYDESTYSEIIKELLDAGYIDQDKADRFIQNINSESVQAEIIKEYNLYAVDSYVKEVYYSAEAGELEKQLIEAQYVENDALVEELNNKYMEQLEKDGVVFDLYDNTYYQDAVDHLLSEGYIDQAKADRFTQNIDSESVQAEIVKDYTLYAIDLWVKDGYYSEETGKLEKQIVEAEYAGNDSLAEELRNKYMEQLENDELASFYELG